jgi:glycerol kinase
MQRLADLLALPVDRPRVAETTALGAADLAGLQTGFFPDPDRFAAAWQLDRRFTPAMEAATRNHKLRVWNSAVQRVLEHSVDF